MWNMTPFEVSS